MNIARHQREKILTWRQEGSGLCNKRAITCNQHVAAHWFVKKHLLRRKAQSSLVEWKVNYISIFLFHILLFISPPIYLPTIPSHIPPFPPSSPSPVSSHSNNLCMCCSATVVCVILLLLPSCKITTRNLLHPAYFCVLVLQYHSFMNYKCNMNVNICGRHKTSIYHALLFTYGPILKWPME